MSGMHAVEQGEGEPVVLVHGSLLDRRYWRPQMEAFAASWRTIAVSLRHYWPDTYDGSGFTMDQHVEDLAGFCAGLGAPVRLVGHSRGAHAAFRVAERHPQLVRALVLAEPGGDLDASFGQAPSPGPAGAAAEAVQALRDGDPEAALRIFAGFIGHRGPLPSGPDDWQSLMRDNVTTLLGQVDEGRKPYARAAVAALPMPVLLVGGGSTTPGFRRILDAFAAAIPGARRASIAGAGHCMSAESPAAFNAAVLAFLATTR